MANKDEEFESILETYDFEDILNMNDLTLKDALEFLVEEGLIELPEIKPLGTWDNDQEIVELDAYEI